MTINTLFKFPGNKRKLVPQVMNIIPPPEELGFWVEPFCGGGATAIAAWRRGHNVVICDKNKALMQFYQMMQDPEQYKRLFTKLELAVEFYNELDSEEQDDVYRKIRTSFNVAKVGEMTEHTIVNYVFLTMAGFNGLQRENKKGEFNVPRGKSANSDVKRLVRPADRREVWDEYHQFCNSSRTTILPASDWQEVMERYNAEGNVIVCDPPYADTFTSKVHRQYLAGGFPDEETELLYQRGAESAARVAIHNSWGNLPIKMSEKYDYEVFNIYAPRTIACNGNRDSVKEILSISRT